MDAEAIRRFRARYVRARGLKDETRDLVDRCYELALPLRRRSGQTANRPMDDGRFDSTAADAVQGFASQMLDDVWPVDGKPFELAPGRAIPEDKQRDAAAELSQIADVVLSVITNSRFRSAAYEGFQDYAVQTLVMTVLPGDAAEPIRFAHVPLPEAVLERGPHGGFDGYWRERTEELGDIATLWPGAKLPHEWAKRLRDEEGAAAVKVTVLEGVTRDWTTPAVERWRFAVLPQGVPGGESEALVENIFEGEGSCPFIACAFSEMGGPVMTALADIRTLNAIKEMTLEGADMSLSPMWLYDNDGTINPDTTILEPGALIPRTPTRPGLEPIVPRLDTRLAELEINDLRSAIKNALFVQDLGPTDQTPRSATEVIRRETARAKRLAGAYGNLLVDFLFALVKRVLWILKHHHGLPGLPPFTRQAAEIRPLAPLTRAMQQDNLQRWMRYWEIGAQTVGPQAMQLAVDGEKWVQRLAEQTGFPPDMLRSPAEIAKKLQELAAAAQQAGVLPAQQAAQAPAAAPGMAT